MLIKNELRRSNFEDIIAAGVVLTGGSSKMEGAVELAEEVFHMPVRLGMPQFVKGLGEVVRNPIHATGVGILLYARDKADQGVDNSAVRGGLQEIWSRMKAWFQGSI
jgi:cell division protein FtsA